MLENEFVLTRQLARSPAERAGSFEEVGLAARLPRGEGGLRSGGSLMPLVTIAVEER